MEGWLEREQTLRGQEPHAALQRSGPQSIPLRRYATTPIASSCTAGDPSTSVKPVTAGSTAPCTMTGTFASTYPRKVSTGPGGGYPAWL